MTPRKSLLVNAFHSLGTNIGLIIMNFFLNVVLTRTLGPEGKGEYSLFITTSSLLVVFLGFSLPSGITYSIAQSSVSSLKMTRWLILVVLLQGWLAIILLNLIKESGVASFFLPHDQTNTLIICTVAYITLILLASYWQAILFGWQEFILANRVAVQSRLIDAGCLFLLLFILWKINWTIRLNFLVVTLSISALISNGLYVYHLRNYFALSSTGVDGFKQVVGYAMPSYLGNLVQFLNYRLDMFFVNALAGQEALGFYALAVSLAQLLWLPSNAIAGVLLPKIAEQQDLTTYNADVTTRITRFTLYISLVFGFLLGLFGVVAIPFLYGWAFQQSIILLLFILPGTIAISPAFVLASYIAGIGKPKINLFIALVAVFFTVVLDSTLIPKLGALGASLASTVSYSVTTILTSWFFLRQSGLPLKSLLLITQEDRQLGFSTLQMILRRIKLAQI